jgi:hypothetical protein
MTTTAETTAAVVAAMKAEITAFIEGGDIPADVPDFQTLHDYVDANMLAFEVYATEIPEDETDEQGEARMDRETPIFNAASSEVDRWLRAGRPEVMPDPVHTPCTAPGLACENPAHDHFTNDPDDNRTADGGRLCNDCGAPCHWDDDVEDYYHDDPATPSCFLIH